MHARAVLVNIKAFIIANRKKHIRQERAYGLCGSGNTDSVSMRVGLITRRVTTSDAWSCLEIEEISDHVIKGTA